MWSQATYTVAVSPRRTEYLTEGRPQVPPSLKKRYVRPARTRRESSRLSPSVDAREAQAHRPRARRPRVGGQLHEADERAGLGDPGGEGLLRVAHAVAVDVARLEDREVAVDEARRPEPAEAGAVALAAPDADADRQVPSVGPPRDDLAPVRDVQPDRGRAARVRRLREVRVVDARVGQQAPVPLAGEEERRQEPRRVLVGRAVRRREQPLAPRVVPRAERAIHAPEVARAQARLRAAARARRGRGR